jgi:hypothetical protein
VKREAEEELLTMTHHEDLSEADRLIADCMGEKNRPPEGKGRPGLGSLDKGWCRQ